MPELPEVEVVRRGLQSWVAGRKINEVYVHDARSIRRHQDGLADFIATLQGTTIIDIVRRGKFLWMPLDGVPGGAALVAHLGMSGQLLVEDSTAANEKHLKITFDLSASAAKPEQLRFVDQRIFGGMLIAPLVPTTDGAPGGQGSQAATVPQAASHIARDVLDLNFDIESFHRRLRIRRTSIKRAMLDQGLVSGVGNIYADEALWEAQMHYARPTDTLRRPDTVRLVDALSTIMDRALAAGGTSFDQLYVNVNGASGYFSRSLNAYGRNGQQCHRCADEGKLSLIRRDAFMGRSSYWCPACQRVPRNARF
ncbi:bifunctional DNA-formamidopyrimidine glycosylase/DNA-(apurinic or apyrimidinic site) lyase [Arthrobacter sp. 179]|uniref:bifunctional DNA-formamidopyrimidine glycosylase/DNA-(apurinic or apyrimidinic site) lyase n=1 Tax=Arthrobacter sp. 179 TaxID=3457734 RepID=UPI004033ED0A